MKNEICCESEGNINLNFLVQSSSTSTFTKISNDKQNFIKRNKGGKRDKKKNNINYYQFSLLIFGLILMIFQIVCHISINDYDSFMGFQNQALSIFKKYFGFFHTIFSSILSLVCLANETGGDNCTSITGYYQIMYNKLVPNNELNLTEFILALNKYNSNSINSIKKRILKSLIDYEDKNLNNLLNMEMPVLYISQNISQNENKITVFKTNNTFSEVFDYMTNGLLVMSSNYDNLKEIVYIVNKEDDNDLKSSFINVKSGEKLSQYQIYFYYIILNFHNFIQRLDI
jgi:hypothetical protein